MRAPVRGLLTAERTALNLLCHLSGVATATAAWVDAVAGTGARIRDTRKTLPGLRLLEKYAVRCGGGVNHRLGLGDAVLIKDNHVAAAGSVGAALAAARAAAPDLPCEVEVDTLEQLDEVLALGAELVLLDNFTSAHRGRRSGGAGDRPTRLESSGGLHAGERPGLRRDRRGLPGGRRADPLRAARSTSAWTCSPGPVQHQLDRPLEGRCEKCVSVPEKALVRLSDRSPARCPLHRRSTAAIMGKWS